MNILTAIFRVLMISGLVFVGYTVQRSNNILIKGDIPQMQRDIQELKVQGQKYVTTEQLLKAIRVELEIQLRSKPITTDTDGGKHYEK
jgi:hypothetical protein